MKIGIAGIGGIGSNVARHLAQARVRALKIVDFDCVEAANLNRQFYSMSQVGAKKTDSLVCNLRGIYPEICIETVDWRIKPGDAVQLFSDCAVVVEGFDDKKLKKMLLEELAASGKVVVSASGIAGSDTDGVKIRKMGNCRIVGDFVSDQRDFPLFPPKIAMVAAMMAAIVLRHMEDGSDE